VIVRPRSVGPTLPLSLFALPQQIDPTVTRGFQILREPMPLPRDSTASRAFVAPHAAREGVTTPGIANSPLQGWTKSPDTTSVQHRTSKALLHAEAHHAPVFDTGWCAQVGLNPVADFNTLSHNPNIPGRFECTTVDFLCPHAVAEPASRSIAVPRDPEPLLYNHPAPSTPTSHENVSSTSSFALSPYDDWHSIIPPNKDEFCFSSTNRGETQRFDYARTLTLQQFPPGLDSTQALNEFPNSNRSSPLSENLFSTECFSDSEIRRNWYPFEHNQQIMPSVSDPNHAGYSDHTSDMPRNQHRPSIRAHSQNVDKPFPMLSSDSFSQRHSPSRRSVSSILY
jgi:hypothetical protein